MVPWIGLQCVIVVFLIILNYFWGSRSCYFKPHRGYCAVPLINTLIVCLVLIQPRKLLGIQNSGGTGRQAQTQNVYLTERELQAQMKSSKMTKNGDHADI